MKEFKGRVAVVTGSASGIGRAVADRLAREGMRMVLADLDEAALDKARAEIEADGAEVLAVRTDVSKPEQVENLAKQALDRFGAVHVLVNNAGVVVTGAAWENTPEDWQWVLGVNLYGAINGMRTFVPIMLEQDTECHVVSTSSMAGLASNAGIAVYNVSKHGVVTLSETLYHDLNALGSKISVSVLCPGYIRTNLMDCGRLRPGDLAKDPPKQAATVLAVAANEGLAEGIEQGLEPSSVAERVFKAIRDKEFYILHAQDEILQLTFTRCQDILAQRNPTTAGVVVSDV